MIASIKRLLCKHRNLSFYRNIYGDEINHCGGKRSMWECQDCGKIALLPDLFTPFNEYDAICKTCGYRKGDHFWPTKGYWCDVSGVRGEVYAMTVEELIEELSKCPQEASVRYDGSEGEESVDSVELYVDRDRIEVLLR